MNSLTPYQLQFINQTFGAIGRVIISSRGNPAPGQALILENDNGKVLDVDHWLAIPTPDGHVSFAVTLTPNILSDLDINQLVDEGEDPMTARPIVRSWILEVTCNTANTSRPAEALPVYYASALGVEFALGINRIPPDKRLPIGVVANGDGDVHPAYLHVEYLLGQQGVHANWGGLSGLSGKTSKKALTEFAALSLRQRFNLRCAVVIFASKGSDELFRDLPADPQHPFWVTHPELFSQIDSTALLTQDEVDPLNDMALYRLMELPLTPFEKVELFVPQGDGQWWSYRTPETNGELGTAHLRGFEWSLRQVAPYMSLFASTDADDKLRAMEAEVLRALRDGYWVETKENTEKKYIHTLSDLEDFFEYASEHLDRSRRWHGHHVETISRARAHYLSIFRRASQVVSSGVVSPENSLPLTELQDGSMWVLDLSQLKPEAKMLVIYKVMAELHELMQANRLPLDRVILDVDELNQNAPRRASSSSVRLITSKIQDIAERARTDGVILFTAQQTLSEIDDRVEANLATRFYGMMGAQEARQPVYGFTELERYLVERLEPGEMLVQHPLWRHLVKVRVPRPPFLRGKVGQALLTPVTTELTPEKLKQLLSGHYGRVVPSADELHGVIATVQRNKINLQDLVEAAKRVGQIKPLEGERNNAQATLSLLRQIMKGTTQF